MQYLFFATLLSAAYGFQAGDFLMLRQNAASRTCSPNMINLFGNNEESNIRRSALSFRDAQAGDRKVTFRKPNQATDGLVLGLKFREGFGKGVFIDKIIPGTEAARLKSQGKIIEGDEVVMVSATFGEEMWSARGIGKYRLEKSIAVRQGNGISFVFEDGKNSAKRLAGQKKAIEQKQQFQSRLQKQLQEETDAAKATKKGPFGLW